MNRKWSIIFYVLIFLYAIYHIFSLTYSPLPWYDEVYFASITRDYMAHHTYFCTSFNLLRSQLYAPGLVYGPLFFAAQGFVAKIFGFSMFNLRIVNLLPGLVVLFLIYKICTELKFKPIATLVAILMISLDPIFNQNLHSGRMEFVTLFFFLFSFLVFIKTKPGLQIKYLALPVITGVLLALALLTTPRIIFAFSVYFAYFLYELFTARKQDIKFILIKYALILITTSSLYLIWVYTAFGGIQGYIHYYTGSPRVMKHIGYHNDSYQLTYSMYYIYLYIYAFIALILLLINKGIKASAPLLMLTIPSILFFLIIVNGLSGSYYALIIPFIDLLIVWITMHYLDSKPLRLINYGIVSIFGLIFIFKALSIFKQLDDRNPAYFTKEIAAYIPKNADVSADFQYYYMVIDNNDSFQAVENNGSRQEQEEYLEKDKPEYVILCKYSVDWKLYEYPYIKNNYKLIATLDLPKKDNTIIDRLFKHIPIPIYSDYSGYIYKRSGN